MLGANGGKRSASTLPLGTSGMPTLHPGHPLAPFSRASESRGNPSPDPLLIMRTVCLLIALVLAGTGRPAPAQPMPLPQAHAHNDYAHERPLLDALDRGFGSVEADVHLVDGALLVAHDLEDVQPDRTLERLYLDPLRERARRNGGSIHPGAPPLLLLVDIKSEAEATYAALRRLLRQYADLLTIFTPDARLEGAVTVVISGNRPRATMEAEAIRFAAYDGRLEDLSAEVPASPAFMPLVSSHWARISEWSGDGPFPEEARARLEQAVRTAHAQGRQLRFWATPDHAAAWQLLLDAGVDLVNTDDLDGLAAFLRSTPRP